MSRTKVFLEFLVEDLEAYKKPIFEIGDRICPNSPEWNRFKLVLQDAWGELFCSIDLIDDEFWPSDIEPEMEQHSTQKLRRKKKRGPHGA